MQTQISIIEEKTSKIVTPLFQACFSAGSLFGALCAAFFIQNISDPRITFILVGSIFFIYFLFEWQLAKYLPKGLPVFEDAFLWIDNFRWEYLM